MQSVDDARRLCY